MSGSPLPSDLGLRGHYRLAQACPLAATSSSAGRAGKDAGAGSLLASLSLFLPLPHHEHFQLSAVLFSCPPLLILISLLQYSCEGEGAPPSIRGCHRGAGPPSPAPLPLLSLLHPPLRAVSGSFRVGCLGELASVGEGGQKDGKRDSRLISPFILRVFFEDVWYLTLFQLWGTSR